MRVAADTNVFGYAEALDDARKSAIANRWLLSLDGEVVMSSQVAGELYNILTRKFGRAPADAARSLEDWRNATVFVAPTVTDFEDALALARDHAFQIWDALIVVTSASSGCGVLLSEDMHDGFVYRNLTIGNPFADRIHPRLTALLNSLSPHA